MQKLARFAEDMHKDMQTLREEQEEATDLLGTYRQAATHVHSTLRSPTSTTAPRIVFWPLKNKLYGCRDALNKERLQKSRERSDAELQVSGLRVQLKQVTNHNLRL